MRGIAALLVVCEHIMGRPPYAIFNSIFSFLDGLGSLGVAAFFVISGTVLPLSLGKNYRINDFARFLVRRVVRIEPTFLVSVIASSLLIATMSRVAPQGDEWHLSLKQFALHAFYLIPFTEQEWIQPVYWTLAVEFQFYLLVGMIFPALTASSRWSSVFPVCAATAFSLLAFLHPILPGVGILKYAPLFAAGMVIALGTLYPNRLALTIIALFTCLSLGALTRMPIGFLIGGAIGSAVIMLWKGPSEPNVGWSKPFWWLGTVSYSLYVMHQCIASAGENVARFALRVIPGALGETVANIVPLGSFAAALGAACLLYRLVEHPTQLWSRRLRSYRR